MLEYNDEMKQMVDQSPTLDDQLAELNELCRHGVNDFELYDKIRSFVLHQIKIEELAVTIVLQDLLKIKTKRKHTFDRIVYFICNSDKSYQQMAEDNGCSAQTFYSTIKCHAKKIKWLDNLMKIKRAEDGRRYH